MSEVTSQTETAVEFAIQPVLRGELVSEIITMASDAIKTQLIAGNSVKIEGFGVFHFEDNDDVSFDPALELITAIRDHEEFRD